jgi:hypothetical protein
MTARELFSDARSQVVALEAIRREISALRAARGVTGRASGTFDNAGGGTGGICAGERLYDLEDREQRLGGIVSDTLEDLTCVLYGESGRGGVAGRLGSAAADCVCGYYLMAMTWPQVAAEMVRPESKDGAQWCRRRAYRALQLIDDVGFVKLCES